MTRLGTFAPLLLLTVVGCSKTPHIQPDQAPPVRVKVVSVSASQANGAQRLTGPIMSVQMADLSSQVMAPVAEIRVREGDTVHKGQVLVRLSSSALASGVQQAQAQLVSAQKQESAAAAQKTLAEQTFSRYKTLSERQSVTPQEFDQVKAQLASAQAQQQAAEAQVHAAEAGQAQAVAANNYTVITAPFDGVVTGKYVDAGAMASPGTPLLRIENSKRFELHIQINESALHDIRLGQMVPVRVLGSQAPLSSKVREIVPAGDPAAHTFTVKIELPQTRGLYSGMTADVDIPTAQQNATALVVPRSSIRQQGQLDSVLALDSQSIAQIRYVSLGRTLGNAVEVVSGLQPGEKVVEQENDALIGRRIEPQP